jgi:hypothetical protein
MTTALAAKIARDYGTPAAVIDMDRVERNIARIQAACDTAGVANRPHIKTHKSPMLAKLQIAAGARGITCQKLGEGSRPGCRRQRSYGSWPATRRAGPFSRRRAGRERGLKPPVGASQSSISPAAKMPGKRRIMKSAPVTMATRPSNLIVMTKIPGFWFFRHRRPCAGHPRILVAASNKTWMARTSPAMTSDARQNRSG